MAIKRKLTDYFLIRLVLITSILMVLGAWLMPQKAEAHDMYYLQTTIDVASYKYTGLARMDKTGITGMESGHVGYDYNFKDLLGDNNMPVVKGTDYKLDENDNKTGDPKFAFGFPFQEQGEMWGGKDKNNATKADADQAQYIASTLPTQLNDFIDLVYAGKRPSDMDGQVERMEKVTTAIKTVSEGGTAKIGDFTITRGKLKPYKKGYDTTYGISNNDWITVTNGDFQQDFIYRVPKGYIKVGDWNNSSLKRDYDYDDDSKYVSWNMVIYQAHYLYFAAGVSTSNSYAIGEPGYLEQKVVELLESLLNGLNGILGLYSMEELIFNEGIRDSSAWHYGVFPTSYDNVIDKFHMIFQAIAWSLLIAAMYKLLIQRNLSVVNPAMRVSLMNGVLDLFITGAILALIFPLINFLMLINYRFVDIFASMGVDLDNLAGLNSYNGLISGILMQFFYFFIEVWLNFVYIVRSITLAILVVASPLFVAAIAFGTKWKQLFGTFMKELTANIFIQSFQAFVITFILLTASQSRGIELAIIMFSLITLTEFFRGLVFGNAGGVASRVGMNAIKTGFAGASTVMRSASSSKNKGGGKEGQSQSKEDKGGEADAGSGESSGSNENFVMSKIKNPTAKAAAATAGSLVSTGANLAMAGTKIAAGAGYALAFGAMDDSGAAGRAAGEIAGGAASSMAKAGNALGNAGASADAARRAYQAKKAANAIPENLQGGAYHQDFDDDDTVTMPTNQNASEDVNISDDANASTPTPSPTPVPNPATSAAGSTAAVPSNVAQAVSNRTAGKTTKDGIAHDNITLDRAKMENMGVTNMNTDGGGRLYTRYNPENMSKEDSKQLEMMNAAYNYGTQEDKEALKAMGVERVAQDDKTGEYIVTYNNEGREAMGVDYARTSSNGMTQTVPAGTSPNVILPTNTANFSQQARTRFNQATNPQPSQAGEIPMYRTGASQPAPYSGGADSLPFKSTPTKTTVDTSATKPVSTPAPSSTPTPPPTRPIPTKTESFEYEKEEESSRQRRDREEEERERHHEYESYESESL